MKIRVDFVSNSSSSSFIIIGCDFDSEEIENLARQLGMDPDDPDFSQYDVLEKAFGDKQNFKYESDYDVSYVGFDMTKMKDSDSVASIKSRVSQAFAGITTKKPEIISGVSTDDGLIVD